MSERYKEDNIVNIDRSARYRGNKVNQPKARRLSGIRPEHIGTFIFVLIFLYLLVNLYIYINKEEVSIYEVQAQDISHDSQFTGVVVRDEQLIRAPKSGNINYFVANGKRASKNSLVYSLDAGSTVYTSLKKGFEEYSLKTEEIAAIKDMVNRYMTAYNGMNIEWVADFNIALTDTIYDIVNENMLNQLDLIAAMDQSKSALIRGRASESGVISYKADSLTGLGSSGILPEMYETKYSVSKLNLRSTGLIGEGDPVYRLCSSENWSIIIKVSEDFYISNLENDKAYIYINNSAEPVYCYLRCFQQKDGYYIELSLNDYMSKYIDERILKVEFVDNREEGLKIPVSAIHSKGFYLVPMTCFMKEEGIKGQFIKKEIYDEDGSVAYEYIHPNKFYSDGYYAYVDMELLDEGDIIVNTETGERVKVALVNYLEGVYNVNKGYYQFVRIDRIRQNNEYVIVKSNTPDGIRQYDHIALNSKDAVEQQLIY